MSIEITWQEPPTPTRGRKPQMDYVALAAALKERPGRWALVFKDKPSSNGTTLQRHGLEIRCVSGGLGYGLGRHDIYARWPELDTTKGA